MFTFLALMAFNFPKWVIFIVLVTYIDRLTGVTGRGVWEDPPDATSKYVGLLLCCRLLVLN